MVKATMKQRENIELDPTRAAGSVIRQAVQNENVRAALAIFLDGRGAVGDYELHVVSGRGFRAWLAPVAPAKTDP